jgi:hypothetical protein
MLDWRMSPAQVFPALFLLLLTTLATPTPVHATLPTVANTVPNIIARLEAAGEKVQIVSQATDPARVTWIILSQENPDGALRYSLLKTIGGGADGVLDGINVPMQIAGLVNSEVVTPLTLNFIRYLLEAHNNDLQATQEYITDRAANFSGSSAQIRALFAQFGLQLP